MQNNEQFIMRTKRLLLIYLFFGISMAYLETAVVVYLRLLYYPHGFRFPLMQIPFHIALIETGREAATLLMLWLVARMAAKSFKEQFALFIYTFAVWDIFYYIWLEVLLGWPQGVWDWDILFLIPVPWIAPWLAPAIVSAALIFSAVLILFYEQRFTEYILSKTEWLGEIFCAAIILFTFFYQTPDVLRGGIPGYYPWWLFGLAMAAGLTIFLRRLKNN